MYERSRRRQLTVLAALLAAAIVCITIDFRQPDGGPVDRLQRLAIATFGPLQQGTSAVVRPVADLAGMPVELGGLRAACGSPPWPGTSSAPFWPPVCWRTSTCAATC